MVTSMGTDELDSIRGFGRRVGRSHPTIIQAIEEGRIKAVKRDPTTGKVLGIYWRQAVGEYAANTDPMQAERTGAARLNESVAAAGVLADAPSQAGEIPPRAAGTEYIVRGKVAADRGGNEAPAAVTGTAFPAAAAPDLVNAPSKEDAGALAGAAQLPLTGQDTTASSKEGAGPQASALVRESDPHGYLEHRARTEKFKAKQAELEYLKDLGLLVSAAEVREAQFRRDRTLRDKLLNVPDRIATVVAAERDPARVHHQISNEIKRILNELSIDAAAEAAGGAPQRVAA
jgi:hypothetical protein